MNDDFDNSSFNDNDLDDKISIDPKDLSYIIPPGLYEAFNEFVAHCEVARNQPIMVVGDTGVGKSVFLHIFKKVYEERCKENNIKPNVIWANCAHFGGHHSDINLARSELFGYVGGAFTGANKGGKRGLVEKADGGLLILEELDELPEQVQAMLLTFIETGMYNKVGLAKPERAEVQLIGATNDEEALRKDFRYRVFPFYIPPLHERRQDVLYYIAAEFPELIKSLNISEVLVLLSYNWPGNVREVDRVARLMLRQRVVSDRPYLKTKKKTSFNDSRLNFPDIRYTFLNGLQPILFLDWVASWGGDKFLVPYLKKHGLNLSNQLKNHPFNDLDESTVINLTSAANVEDEMKDLLALFEVKVVPAINAFDRTYRGFRAFCGIFGQRTSKNKDILTDLKNGEIYSFTSGRQRIVLTRYWKSKHLKRKSDTGNVIPEEIYDFWSRLEEQIDSDKPFDSWYGLEKLNNSDKPQDSDYMQIKTDISGMTEEQLLKTYYEGLLATAGGSVKDAAKMAGIKYTTFRARLDKMSVLYHKLYH